MVVPVRKSKGREGAAKRVDAIVVGVGVVLLTCLDNEDGVRGCVGDGREACGGDGDTVFCAGD